MSEETSEQRGSRARRRGRVVMIAEVLTPLRHGGETEGNVQMFRTKRVWGEHGAEDVPYVSANSVKHWLRANAAMFALEALGLTESRALTREQIHLLFSGGALTKSGATIKLGEARELEGALPFLGTHGYAAGSTLTSANIRVSDLDLACLENDGRVRRELAEYAPEFLDRLGHYGTSYLEEGFGTRHEPARASHVEALLSEAALADYHAEVDSSEKGDSAQMYYEYQQLVPGSVLVGGFSLPHGASELEVQSLRSALTYGSEGRDDKGRLLIRLGARGAVGFGLCAVSLHGLLARGVETWEYVPTDFFAPERAEGGSEVDDDEGLGAYVAHLREHEERAIELMEELL